MPQKVNFDFSALGDFETRLAKMGDGMKPYIEDALKQSHSHITGNLEKDAQPNMYPAHGKYSSGDTNKSIHQESRVTWIGDTLATADVGFDRSKTLTSIWLMYGTPRMRPVQELYDDIYSKQTRKEIREIQRKNLKRLLEDT